MDRAGVLGRVMDASDGGSPRPPTPVAGADPWPFGDLPRRHFGCIVADPPWAYKSRTALQSSNWHSRRDAEKHYSVLGLEELKALPVRELAGKNCHLFMWVTAPCLPWGLQVMEAWGFKYSSVAFTWVKLRRALDTNQLRLTPSAESDLHVGLGLTTRKNAEFCLLGRRGSPRRVAKDVREIIMSPVREHSRKPEESRERIERYVGPGIPIIELFARSTRPKWTAWGHQTDLFSSPEDKHGNGEAVQ